MKIYILAFLCVFISHFSFSQCEYEQKYIDKFTKDTIVETKPVMIYTWMKGLSISLLRINSTRYICFTIHTNQSMGNLNAKSYCFRENSKCYLANEKDEIITLELSPKNYLECGDTHYLTHINYSMTSYRLLYEADKETFEKLSDFHINAIRFVSTDGGIDFEKLKTNKTKDYFKNTMKCVSKTTVQNLFKK